MSLTIIISVLTILVSFILFLLLGRYIQNKYHLLISNTYIGYAIGFSVYIATVTLIFMPVVFFALPTFMLLSIWWIFNILLAIYLILNWNVINIKNISIKQMIIFISLSILLLVITRFLAAPSSEANNNFFIKWVKNNIDISHLNDGMNINKYDFGEGWYYFQTALLRTLGINQLFMNFWVLGGMVSIFIASSMLGFVYSIIKNNNIFILSGSIGVAILVAWIMYGGQVENIGQIPLIWNFVLLLTLLINFIARPRIHYMYLLAVVSYAGWAFSSKELILSIVVFVSAVFILLFKKSHLLVEFVLVFSYSIVVMVIILIFNISYIAFSLSFLAAIVWWFTVLFLTNKNINKCREYSLIFTKSRWVIFYGSLLTISVISIILWVINGLDPWLNFKYDKNILVTSSASKFTTGVIAYTFYWITVIISIILISSEIKKGIGDNKIKLLLLLSGFGIIIFFNPLAAPLWNNILLEPNLFYNIAIETQLPLVIIFPILISKIKWHQIMQTTIILGTVTSAMVVYSTNDFKKNHVSLYNGVDSTTKELGNYINKKQKYKNMAGDLNGLSAYVNNELSFPVNSKNFNILNNTELTNKTYSKINNKEVEILIKYRDNISVNFDFKLFIAQYNFMQYLIIGHYFIFIK